MKLLSAQQIKDWDAFTIKHEPIASIDLMERAARAFVQKYIELFPVQKSVKIFCGLGNNGGDGLAIARLLTDKYNLIEVFIVEHSSNRSADFKLN
jgi:NAD(P)H-hydrate repair Nnr-like enzyme with NAD(P)H-hydrate epimerase domain